MKSDFTYICLLAPEVAQVIRDIQNRMGEKFGYPESAKQWEPHVTVSFGSQLTEEEQVSLQEACAELAKNQKPVRISYQGVEIAHKTVQDETFYAVRLKVVPNPELEMFSEKLGQIVKQYEVPFDAFTTDHFHTGMGRYQDVGFDEATVSEFVDLSKMPEIWLTSFSLFYSLFNTPKPDKAKEAMTWQFEG